jgi:hypothetical protein
MTNQISVSTSFTMVADGTSNTLLINLLRSPVFVKNPANEIGAFTFLANPFGGTTQLPSSVTVVSGTGPTTASIDRLGNVLLTFTGGAPAAGNYGITLTLFFNA